MNQDDTIVAIATATGRAGVGIIRVSGPNAVRISEQLTGKQLTPRYAHYGPVSDRSDMVLDEGISLLFPGPHSFTGEDVYEFQGHGGPVILDILVQQILVLGARLARPGEFSQRAFLNDKLDLAQAEAIADLIDSVSEQAARSALRSLQGEFSKRVNELVEALIQLRIYVEAAIDFPEEEIDFLADGKVTADLDHIITRVNQVFIEANRGALMRDGMNVVIAGRPNAGKSSLLNALAGHERAIVTDIAGTTRDVLKEHIHIDGMPLHIIDTAGLRDAPDEVERIGIEKAWHEITEADLVLLMVDSTETSEKEPLKIWPEFVDKLPKDEKITVVRNKCDLSDELEGIEKSGNFHIVRLSAKTHSGIDYLRNHLKAVMGYDSHGEGAFIARRRHLDALSRAQYSLQNGHTQLTEFGAGELLAEDLRDAQNALSEITGAFSSDDLLGRIFSSFCIGK